MVRSWLRAIATLSGGGDFAVLRYNTNGSLDKTFKVTGRRVFSINSGFDSWAKDVIVQSNGKIVVLGTADISGDYDFAVVRLNSGGGFDTTFSGDGKVTVNFSGLDYGSSLTLQPLDHKYLLGGNTNYGVGVYDFALARVLP